MKSTVSLTTPVEVPDQIKSTAALPETRWSTLVGALNSPEKNLEIMGKVMQVEYTLYRIYLAKILEKISINPVPLTGIQHSTSGVFIAYLLIQVGAVADQPISSPDGTQDLAKQSIILKDKH